MKESRRRDEKRDKVTKFLLHAWTCIVVAIELTNHEELPEWLRRARTKTSASRSAWIEWRCSSRVSAEARSCSAKSTGFGRRLWRVSGGSGGAWRQRRCSVVWLSGAVRQCQWPWRERERERERATWDERDKWEISRLSYGEEERVEGIFVFKTLWVRKNGV